jgi:hypothetical protein
MRVTQFYPSSITKIKSMENCRTARYRTHTCFHDEFTMSYNKTEQVYSVTPTVYTHINRKYNNADYI